jgi:hypothetical protein
MRKARAARRRRPRGMPRPRPILEDWDRPLEEEEGVGDWEVEVNAVDEVGLEGEEEVVDWGGELVEAAGVAVEPVATLLADAVALLTILLAATVSEAIAGMV